VSKFLAVGHAQGVDERVVAAGDKDLLLRDVQNGQYSAVIKIAVKCEYIWIYMIVKSQKMIFGRCHAYNEVNMCITPQTNGFTHLHRLSSEVTSQPLAQLSSGSPTRMGTGDSMKSISFKGSIGIIGDTLKKEIQLLTSTKKS
jgi:hypothetical protein